MRRLTLLLAALIAAAVIAPAAAFGRVVVEPSAGFTTSHASLISGWWWLRSTGASATWTFSATGVRNARVGTVYVLLSPLVTNHVNGGSGYARSVRLVFTRTSLAPARTRTSTVSASLYNPFRPKVDQDTHGVGYQTYGFASVSSSIWRPSPLPPRRPTTYNPTRISVTLQWTKGYHVAVNSDAMKLAYVTP